MDVTIPEKIKHLVDSITLKNKVIRIKFTQNYNNKEISLPFNLKDISKSLSKFENKMKEKVPTISSPDYNEIEEAICQVVTQSDEQKEIKEKKKEITINKYSQNRRGELFESILIGNEPFFVSMGHGNDNDGQHDDEIKLIPSIDENTRILKPPSSEEYLHIPYEFASKDDLVNVLKHTREHVTIFSLYRKAKVIVPKYIDQEEYIVNLIAIDVIISYFQDRFNTTHYTGIFGDNGSGKSSIGDVVEALGYRAVNTTDPTPANIFRSLGSVEAGQIILILDEAEKVDQSQEMMSILKTGYDFRKHVSRINQNSGKPERFCTYCLKLIIGERPPGQNIAKGIMDRTFTLAVYVGNPKHDIKEILNPTDTGGEEQKELLKEITDFRNELFAFRILHFKDKIRNIDIGIKGRNKELVKPCLQLFSNPVTEEDKKSYKEIENTFNTLLKIKNNKKDFTLEASLIPIIIELMHESKKKVVAFSDFWTRLKENVNGHFDERKPNEYHTEEFGTIYRNSISNMLQKLGVESKHHSRFTELIFNKKKILRIAVQYNYQIQTSLDFENDDGGENNARNEHNKLSFENVADNNKKDNDDNQNIIEKTAQNKCKIDENSNPVSANDASTNDNNQTINNGLPQEHSEHSQQSPYSQTQDNHHYSNNKEEIQKSIYRVGKTDNWKCNNCKQHGDKWYMRQHPCKGLNKNNSS